MNLDAYPGKPPEAKGIECEFCKIVAGRLPRTLVHEEADLIAFRNALTWTSVMYLIIPRAHVTQAEFWNSPLFPRAAVLATQLGERDSPEGFRLVSNFGQMAAQTQVHGHLHVLGGGDLGLYMDFPRKGDYWLRRFGYTEREPDPLQSPSEQNAD